MAATIRAVPPCQRLKPRSDLSDLRTRVRVGGQKVHKHKDPSPIKVRGLLFDHFERELRAELSVADVRISAMPMCDYFSAADDEAAVAVLQTPGGAGSASLDVVYLKNIDPVVCMARLEAIMAGCRYEEASQRPRSGQLLSSPEAESAFVMS